MICDTGFLQPVKHWLYDNRTSLDKQFATSNEVQLLNTHISNYIQKLINLGILVNNEEPEPIVNFTRPQPPGTTGNYNSIPFIWDKTGQRIIQDKSNRVLLDDGTIVDNDDPFAE